MAPTIWKFPLPKSDSFALEMPKGAELLFVSAQGEFGCMWARVIPEGVWPLDIRVAVESYSASCAIWPILLLSFFLHCCASSAQRGGRALCK